MCSNIKIRLKPTHPAASVRVHSGAYSSHKMSANVPKQSICCRVLSESKWLHRTLSVRNKSSKVSLKNGSLSVLNNINIPFDFDLKFLKFKIN